MKLSFNDVNLDISSNAKTFTVSFGDTSIQAEILRAANGQLDLLINGKRVTAYVSVDNAKRWVTINGQTLILTKSSGTQRTGHGHHHAAGELTSPMPGQVRTVNVGEGDAVTKGQTLLVLEAMKMEIRIHAPHDGTVKKLFVNQGQTVEREQILIEIEED